LAIRQILMGIPAIDPKNKIKTEQLASFFMFRSSRKRIEPNIVLFSSRKLKEKSFHFFRLRKLPKSSV
jgi:hypothetical protein